MSLELPNSVKILSDEPLDAKYLNGITAYASISEANTLIPIGIRSPYLTIVVQGVEYWWKDGAWQVKVDAYTTDETNSLLLPKESTSNKNQNNGYSGLDSGGKVPLQNLPTTLLKYIGVWNASTNTPTLTNPDTTKISNVYNVSVAGIQFGIDFKLGDWLIYNANGIVEKSDNSDDVVSVNGQTGVVTLTLQNVLDADNESTTGMIVNTTDSIGVNASGNYAGVNVSGGNIGVIAYGGNTGVNTTGQVFGVNATGNTGSAGIFNIPSENNSNIVEFTKNNIRQASISHDGKLTANSFIKSGGTGNNVLLDDGNSAPISSLVTSSPTLQNVLDADNESTTGIIVYTTDGIGVNASGGNTGVNVSGGTIGVNAYGGDIGVNANGDNTGIYAYGGNIGVIADSNVNGVDANGNYAGVIASGGTIGVQASGGSIGVNAESGTIGVIAYGGDIGVNARGDNTGVYAYGDNTGVEAVATAGSAGIFRIPLSNNSNIVEFTKNNIRQASISHDGKLTANSFIKSGGTGNNVLLDDGNSAPISSLVTSSPTLQNVLDADNESTTGIIVYTTDSIGISASGSDVAISASGGNIGVLASGSDVGVETTGASVGVIASGGQIGVQAYSNVNGVDASGNYAGVIASGGTIGVQASGGGIGVIASGSDVAISADGGSIGVDAEGGTIGVQTSGGQIGVQASGSVAISASGYSVGVQAYGGQIGVEAIANTGSAGIFRIPLSNNSNIVQFTKNDIIQASISHDGNVLTNAIKKTNGSNYYGQEDGTVLYHNVKWFTPTGTFSTAAREVTTTGGQLTGSMVGAKIGVGTEKRIIVSVSSGDTCTVDSAFSQNYVNQPLADWGVYSKSISFLPEDNTTTNGGFTIRNATNNNLIQSVYDRIEIGRMIADGGNNVAFNTTGVSEVFQMASDKIFVWHNGLSSNNNALNTPVDLGVTRNSEGILEVNNGSYGNFRDLKLRNIIATTPTYANDAAADADSTLPSGSFYKLTGNRQIFQKP